MLKFFLQLGWEIKVLDNSKYVALSEPLDEVGRMLGGWLRQVTLPPRTTPPGGGKITKRVARPDTGEHAGVVELVVGIVQVELASDYEGLRFT